MGDRKEAHAYAWCNPEFVVPKTWADRAVQNYRDSKISKAGVKVPMTWVDEVLTDAINPQHYQQYKGLEVIDLTEQLNFCRGNVVKYVARAGKKAGASEIEDLRKARWYLDREIRRLESEDVSGVES